jgi:hypothetical protein
VGCYTAASPFPAGRGRPMAIHNRRDRPGLRSFLPCGRGYRVAMALASRRGDVYDRDVAPPRYRA